jgi:hypothetical protein
MKKIISVVIPLATLIAIATPAQADNHHVLGDHFTNYVGQTGLLETATFPLRPLLNQITDTPRHT